MNNFKFKQGDLVSPHRDSEQEKLYLVLSVGWVLTPGGSGYVRELELCECETNKLKYALAKHYKIICAS